MCVMDIDEGLIREIVQRLLGVIQPDRIILFGSAATGPMTRDSDIDLLVVAPAPTHTIEEHVKLRGCLRGLGFPFDVFVTLPKSSRNRRTCSAELPIPLTSTVG